MFERDSAHTLSQDSWDTHLNTNLRAPALLMRDFANQPELQTAAIEDANIINITDQRVERLTPDFASYTVSKTGLATLTETFAMALAPQHIRVNAIALARPCQIPAKRRQSLTNKPDWYRWGTAQRLMILLPQRVIFSARAP